MQKTLKLGASIRGVGYHVSAWRHPDVDPRAAEKIGHYAELARIAEAGLFDMVFFADALATRAIDSPLGAAARYPGDAILDPLMILPALAMETRHVGLVATSSTTYHEPYHIARRFAALDHISGGRAGWNVVTSFSNREAANFNRAEQLSKPERYARATEFLETAIGLWDSWEEGALVADRQSGLFFDPSKVHAVNHVGPHFQVAGPLTSSRVPQGRPLIVQAGASEEGLDLAGRYADVVYSIPRSIEAAIANRRELQARAVKFGRTGDQILSMPGVQVISGETEAEAREKYRVLLDIVDPLTALGMLNRQFGDVFTPEMLDEPVPAEGPAEGTSYSVARESVKRAREKSWTLRQLCQRVGLGQHFQIVGTHDRAAEVLAEWFTSGACDGFNVLPSHTPGNLADFVEHIVPRLQQRGLFRTAYEGATLRENLGLAPL
ncbi:LLM class flavin-dependent oxidoreductase [Salipiger sp. P9]|uniref:LLM class flavin-dependent oxidoreductase n=1 Tax=Salipiger pentaromativorans TaxID=2943193 RepID=UPI002156FCC4|nr:LLM class flavin-dependent oxidoreductase [Salipiger pentaromativorans]MCR8549214.1 LLM class flavin-dependent oxidoreductase [Salipiger pentaromativorans]